MKLRHFIINSLIILSLWGLSACKPNQTTTLPEDPKPTQENQGTQVVQPTATDLPTPTSTPLPAAALVNGEAVLISDFEEEYQRFLDGVALSKQDIDEETGRAIVLEDMIVTTLLAQGARAAGFELTDEFYQTRLTLDSIRSGGRDLFNQWLTDNHYTEESFQRLYRLSLEAGWLKEKIIGEVPLEADQVRARQIMVQSKTLADQIYQQLETGADFATIARIYDPISGGELGWFPQNTLVLPGVEEAVFILEPEEYTPVLDTDYGYQIIQVMERGVRSLTQDALLNYQNQALRNWVEEQKNQSDIKFLN